MSAAGPLDDFNAFRRETATARFFVRADGVLHVAFRGGDQSVPQARENLRCASALLGTRAAPLLLDMSAAGGLPQEVKRYYATALERPPVTAVAVVGDTMLSRVQANLLIATYKLAGTPVPIGLFRSEEEALAWVHAPGAAEALDSRRGERLQ